MIALSFRTKLLLAMILLVASVTATTLLITENQVRSSYERHFQQAFGFQVESFLQQREARLNPVKTRVTEAASSPRIIAAMENAGQAEAGQQDLDDLYQNGIDQLLDVLKASQSGRTNVPPGFFFFLNNQGGVLYPSAALKLPFVLSGLGQIAPQMEGISKAVSLQGVQQVGYLTPLEALGGAQIREMVFTPVVDQVAHRQLGVLAVGLPLLELGVPASSPSQRLPNRTLDARAATAIQDPVNAILSGIWLNDRLYSASVPSEDRKQLEQDLGRQLDAGRPFRSDAVVRIHGAPHQLLCQTLNTGAAFPPAYQICLYSLAAANAEKHSFQQKILVSGTIALLGALGIGLLISRGLVKPLQELVAGTRQIERGNYGVSVPVRSHDEVGRLAQAFNAMTQRVHAFHRDQEQRLAERTLELAELRRAEEALRQSEASLREAQRIAHLGNWEWNVATDELRWSDEIYSIFGLAPHQFRATYEGFLERVHPEDRDKVRQAVRQTVEAGQPYSLEHRIVRPDGEVRIVHERAEVIRENGGQKIHLVGTAQDVTEQKRIEAEFLRAQRLDSIGALASGMAHDLNNALSPILMGIQLIRRQSADPDTRQMLTVMEANTHRGADLVRQVLTFARGRDDDRELLNVGRLVREMENIARQTLPKSITVAAMVPPDLWPVLGNATQVHQVLLNLCINARDAMPNGGELTMAADNVESAAEEVNGLPPAAAGPYVVLLVSDTGTGIAPEVLPRIFEPFFTTKGPGKGTGLGLSTIARIVRNHGGFVSVKSEPGLGTTFEIYFPRAQAVPPSAPWASGPPAALALGHGEWILFIDDDRSVREMVAPTLSEHGYRVLTAANGVEALALFSQHEREVALVLTDFAMPVMDGMTTFETVHARRADLPVILMSGELEAGHEPLPPGVTAFLTKPFRLEQLLAVIAEALQAKTPPDSSA
jgi:two-component system cell cycle sensor histidine kinase/response regulator CckA